MIDLILYMKQGIPQSGIHPQAIRDPDKPAPVNPFRVCFLRNNYYRIKGDYQSLVTMEYILQVSVNPNWEGDVNLPLGK